MDFCSSPFSLPAPHPQAQRPNFLERASVVMVDNSGLTRAPQDKLEHKSLELKHDGPVQGGTETT